MIRRDSRQPELLIRLQSTVCVGSGIGLVANRAVIGLRQAVVRPETKVTIDDTDLCMMRYSMVAVNAPSSCSIDQFLCDETLRTHRNIDQDNTYRS